MLVVPRKFPYNASYKKMILAGGLVAVAGWYSTEIARTNDRGLSIDYIINFDTTGATIFWWVIAGFCFLGTGTAILSMIMHRFRPKELMIDENEIVVPHGFLLSRTQRIPFNAMTNLTETTISRQTLLYIYTQSGKTALAKSLLPEKEDYEDIKQFLIRKLESARIS